MDELLRRIDSCSDLHSSEGNGDTVMLLQECKREIERMYDELKARRAGLVEQERQSRADASIPRGRIE